MRLALSKCCTSTQGKRYLIGAHEFRIAIDADCFASVSPVPTLQGRDDTLGQVRLEAQRQVIWRTTGVIVVLATPARHRRTNPGDQQACRCARESARDGENGQVSIFVSRRSSNDPNGPRYSGCIAVSPAWAGLVKHDSPESAVHTVDAATRPTPSLPSNDDHIDS